MYNVFDGNLDVIIVPRKHKYPKSYFWDQSKLNYEIKKKLFTSINNLTIVTVSDWLTNIVKESFLGSFPIKRIHNGINLKIFHPSESKIIREKYSLTSKQIILGCANVWGQEKGFNDFIQLHKLLRENQQLVMLGLNKKQFHALPKGIIGLERTSSIDELAAWYSAADIFLNLSYEETFGSVTAEALACGTPVIVYNSTASPELVSQNTGRVVDKGNFGSIINAIDEILSVENIKVSNACRQRAEALYNKEDRFIDYIKTYENVLQNIK